jgi:hypothetical protein
MFNISSPGMTDPTKRIPTPSSNPEFNIPYKKLTPQLERIAPPGTKKRKSDEDLFADSELGNTKEQDALQDLFRKIEKSIKLKKKLNETLLSIKGILEKNPTLHPIVDRAFLFAEPSLLPPQPLQPPPETFQFQAPPPPPASPSLQMRSTLFPKSKEQKSSEERGKKFPQARKKKQTEDLKLFKSLLEKEDLSKKEFNERQDLFHAKQIKIRELWKAAGEETEEILLLERELQSSLEAAKAPQMEVSAAETSSNMFSSTQK